MTISTLLFDVGGVLLTNGWDHAQRARAAEHFHLDAAALEAGNARWVEAFENGELGLDDYLARVVFDQPRPFIPAEFTDFIFAGSQPLPDSLDLLGEIAAAGKVRLATVNNEGRELNQYRITHFALNRYFQVFCSSCYLGARKPGAEIFRRALGILQVEPAECLFIDDREENLAAPRALGLDCLHFTSAPALRHHLHKLGTA